MNNTFSEEAPKPEDILPRLREREAELVRLIEAIAQVELCDGWSTLKTYVFDGALESLEGRLTSEAGKSEVTTSELYRLQGQIQWAKKYADLGKLVNTYRLELSNVRKQIQSHGT